MLPGSKVFTLPRSLIQQLEKTTYPVPVVLDACWVNSLAIIRDLAAHGLRSLALTYTPRGVGIYSRHAWGAVIPNPEKDEQGFVDALLTLGRVLPRRGVLCVTDDLSLMSLARHRAELEPYYIFNFPEYARLETILDKVEQLAAAGRCGVPVPHTAVLEPGGALPAWPPDAFPAIVKGRSGKGFNREAGLQVLVVKNPAELETTCRRYQHHGLLIQEIIPGGDENLYSLGSVIARDNRALVAFTNRKLHQFPLDFGTCALGESVECDTVRQQGLRLLREVGFFGPSMTEFKLDPRDGKYKLIEINARFYKAHGLSAHCGVSMAWQYYLDSTGANPAPLLAQKNGVRWWCLPDELRALWQRARLRRSLRPWLRDLRGRKVDSLWTLRDPLPALMHLLVRI